MSGIDREAFLGGYLAEVEEHLASLVRNLGAIGAAGTGAQPRAVREVFRSLHTIKGLSAMVGVEPLVDLSHAMEALVRAADQAGGRIPTGALDLLAEGVRAIEQRLRLVADRKPVPPAPAALLEALGHADGATSSPPAGDALAGLAERLTASEREQIAQGLAAGQQCSRIDFTPTPARSAEGLTITVVRERVGRVGEIVRVVPRSVPRDDAAPAGLSFALVVLHRVSPAELAETAGLDAGAVTAASSVPAATPVIDREADELPGIGDGGGRVIRVHVSRLDDALERLSSLIVTRFRMGRAVADLSAAGVDTRALAEIVHESARQLRDLRGAIMRARMVSVAELLERVPLMVRGLSRSTGKPVAVTIDAGRAELDKAVGERIFPAIVHLIRNAVDHAIEPVDERLRLGKSAEGQIIVTCYERSNNQLELSVRDDGRGVDREAVARRAGRAAPAEDDALLAMLATPGLSTVERATTTSGRGLGVDIVQRIVRELGGEVHLETERGVGTTFTLRVPLSITIVDAFAFSSAGQVFVAPVAAVEEIVEVDPARISATPQRAGALAEVRLIERRGAAVPLVRLDQVFALAADRRSTPAGLHPKALVVRRAGAVYAFEVDRMLGQQEVVVRPVTDALVKVGGVTGSTDLGDGRPVLVLDLIGLSDRLAGGERGARA